MQRLTHKPQFKLLTVNGEGVSSREALISLSIIKKQPTITIFPMEQNICATFTNGYLTFKHVETHRQIKTDHTHTHSLPSSLPPSLKPSLTPRPHQSLDNPLEKEYKLMQFQTQRKCSGSLV